MNSATATLEVHLNPIPGKQKPPTVILRRGKDSNMNLWAWHETARGGTLNNLTVSATLTGSEAPDHLEITIAEGSDQEIETIIRCEAVPPPSPSSAGSVEGTVSVNGGSIAPHATIELKVGDAVIGTAKTGATGAYKIDVSAGDYPAVAALLSGPSREKPLTVGVNIKLIDDTIQSKASS